MDDEKDSHSIFSKTILYDMINIVSDIQNMNIESPDIFNRDKDSGDESNTSNCN